MLCVFVTSRPGDTGPVAERQLRGGRGRVSAALHPLQPLPAPLRRQQAGPRQRRLVRQADPTGVLRPAHTPARHPVRRRGTYSRMTRNGTKFISVLFHKSYWHSNCSWIVSDA